MLNVSKEQKGLQYERKNQSLIYALNEINSEDEA